MKKLTTLAIAALLSLAPVVNADIDNMDIGGDILFMYFYSDDFDLNDNADDQTDFLRTEAHLYFQADLDDNITARISVEADRAAGFNTGANNAFGTTNVDDLEIFLEEAFVQWKSVLNSNFNITAGRQFLNYGDNAHADNYNGWWGNSFVFGDSSAVDPLTLNGLGTYEIDPFDAVVFQYEADAFTVDLVYFIDTEELGVAATGSDNDADGALLYGSYYGIEGHQLDLYFSYNDQSGPAFAGPIGFTGEQYFFGGRAAGDIMPELAYKVEFAYQIQDTDLIAVESEGFAVQGGLNYHPDLAYNPNVGVLFTYFEGDNGSGFNSPFEAKTYGAIAEGFFRTVSGGAFTNMTVINAYGGLQFNESLAGTLDLYYFLLDDEITIGTASEDEGGFEFDAQLDYLVNSNMTAFLGGGVFIPSDAAELAAGGTDDEAFFVRTGFKVSF